MRRAVAIQMIINKELGLNFNENPWQGSFIVDKLTDIVEEAVYKEFEAISERGGVLGAMDTMYQRGKIQEESLYYEHKKHDGTLPLIGVNTFLPNEGDGGATEIELIRSTEGEKDAADRPPSRAFQAIGADALARRALARLREVARARENVFEALMEAVKVASLGQYLAALLRRRRRVPAQHVRRLVDAAGRHRPPSPCRIVCLVPSITELLCDLGLAPQLVGRTGFCIHPWETVRTIPKVGGTKDVKLDRSASSNPRTSSSTSTRTAAKTPRRWPSSSPEVIVTHPLAPRDNLELYRLLGGDLRARGRGRAALRPRFEAALTSAPQRPADRPAADVLYLIWRDALDDVAPDTYISRTLALFNWRTLPADDAERYPVVDPASLAGKVDRVLLSSEPFRFKRASTSPRSRRSYQTPM